MSKQTWKPGNMLYPLPAVMVSVTDGEGQDNNYYSGMGRNGMYQSAYGFNLCCHLPVITMI